MHSQVITVSLILLQAGAVLSYLNVAGYLGHPVTLPCTYSVGGGVNYVCWGRGVCPAFGCSDTLIWTNGYRVTYQNQRRYQLKGQILQGNVSLTIDNLVPSDAGSYCCRVQVAGWFNDLKYVYSLQIAAHVHTSPPTRPTSPPTRPTTRPRPTTTPTTITTTTVSTTTTKIITTPVVTTPSPTWTTETPSTALQETETPLTGLPLSSCTPTDGNETVTVCSDGDCSNQAVSSVPTHRASDTLGLYIGMAVAALMLLLLLSAVLVKVYIQKKMKTGSLSFVTYNVSKAGPLQKGAEVRPRAEDNIYVIEDNLYTTN